MAIVTSGEPACAVSIRASAGVGLGDADDSISMGRLPGSCVAAMSGISRLERRGALYGCAIGAEEPAGPPAIAAVSASGQVVVPGRRETAPP